MNILLIGASGLVGSHFLKYKKSGIAIRGTVFSRSGSKTTLDIRKKTDVAEILKSFMPDVVIVTAAETRVDFCEENPGESARVNVDGIKNVVDSVKSLGIGKFVFFSSNYIFNGKKGDYKETDPVSPINEYGKQKLKAEKYILKNLKDYIIVRTCEVYGHEPQGKNFVVKLVSDVNAGKTRTVPQDQIGNPTYVKNLVEIVMDLVLHNKKGIFNIAGSQVMNRFSFASKVVLMYKLDPKLVVPVLTKDLDQVARRPLNGSLSLQKIKRNTKISIVAPDKGLLFMK